MTQHVTGLYMHSRYTDEGRILELKGPLHLDVFQQNRLIVNGIGLSLKLRPGKNAFRLISSDDGAAYKVQILDASFKLCVHKPHLGVLMTHINLLGDATAMYPNVHRRFKIASVSKGEYSHNGNNLVQYEMDYAEIVSETIKKSMLH